MTTTRGGLLSVLSRTDSPRRETLRAELARAKPTGRRAGLKPKLVLASASPRRLTLLAQVGIEPDALRPSSIDETPKKGEMPRSLVTRLARAKAEDARDVIANDKDIADAYVLAADTIVAVGRRILVKPRFIEEAVAALQLLSGRSHRVLTALCLITPDDRVRLKIVDTRVRFKRLSKEEIEAYIASREWRGKAGGYAIQGLAGCFVQKIVGLLHQRRRAAADRGRQHAAGRGLSDPFQLAASSASPTPNSRSRARQHTEVRGWHPPSRRARKRLPVRSAAGRPMRTTGPSARAAAPMSTSRAGCAAPTPSRTKRESEDGDEAEPAGRTTTTTSAKAT